MSSKLIFGLDLAISVGMSLFALFLTDVLFTSFAYSTSLLLCWLLGSIVSSIIFFLMLQTHKNIIRHSTLRELWKLGIATLGKGAVMISIIKLLQPTLFGNVYIWTALCFDILLTISALVAARVAMVIVYDLIRARQKSHSKRQHVLV